MQHGHQVFVQESGLSNFLEHAQESSDGTLLSGRQNCKIAISIRVRKYFSFL